MEKNFLNNELKSQMADLCQQGKTIEAIKLYKESTGASLKESKEFVEKFIETGYTAPVKTSRHTTVAMDSVTKHELETKLFDLCNKRKILDAISLYKDTTGEPLKESTEFVKKFIETNNIVINKKGRCFVATACYGNYDAPEVFVLRRYRDEKLLTNLWGTAFVKFYYTVSPPIAHQLAKSETLKAFTRKYILGPLIKRIQ